MTTYDSMKHGEWNCRYEQRALIGMDVPLQRHGGVARRHAQVRNSPCNHRLSTPCCTVCSTSAVARARCQLFGVAFLKRRSLGTGASP